MPEKEAVTVFEDVYRTLTRLEDGRISAPQARLELRGKSLAKGPARLIKEGRWASEGGYPSGDAGARMAARDALDSMAAGE